MKSSKENAAHRKRDHIELTVQAQVRAADLDARFYFEPMLAAHPVPEVYRVPFSFLGKVMYAPLWVSSMTGGTEHAGRINHHLAKACQKFGLGMGLGSCRVLLDSDEHFDDFNLRPILGDELPFFANIGIAQVEELLEKGQVEKLFVLCRRLQADGLIVHVNPLQEWIQPEGDRFRHPPVDTIKELLSSFSLPLIVKEVGQGFGPQSIKALLQLPLAAIDFGAAGGTNFALLEMLRGKPVDNKAFEPLVHIGHTAQEMLSWLREATAGHSLQPACKAIILSGGVKNFLDGYYLLEQSPLPAVYGQASALLRHALKGYEDLELYIEQQLKGLNLAKAMLKVREQ